MAGSPILYAATALAVFATIFLIVGAASPTMGTSDGSETGIFKFCISGTCEEWSSSVGKAAEEGINNIIDDFSDKRKASAAFIIIGIMSAGAALGGCILLIMGKEIGGILALGGTAVASFSSLVVFAIWGSIINDTPSVADTKPGAAFALTVIAFFLLLINVGLIFKTKADQSSKA